MNPQIDPNEQDAVVLWAEIWRLRTALRGPDGYATWQDAAVAERARRIQAERSASARVALSDEQIKALTCRVLNCNFYDVGPRPVEFARVVIAEYERINGIGGALGEQP